MSSMLSGLSDKLKGGFDRVKAALPGRDQASGASQDGTVLPPPTAASGAAAAAPPSSSSAKQSGGNYYVSTLSSRLEQYKRNRELRNQQRQAGLSAEDIEERQKKSIKTLFYTSIGLYMLGWLFFWMPLGGMLLFLSAMAVSTYTYVKFRNQGMMQSTICGILSLVHVVILMAYVVLVALTSMFGKFAAGGLFGPFGGSSKGGQFKR